MEAFELITVLGPTASGKTSFAAALGKHLNSEVISADSRQVYRRMDIGTGKDLDDYQVEGVFVPYHLIDICEPGTKYNVFEYQHDFFRVFRQIKEKGKLPILCGGTGLYIESVLKGYKLLDVPPNPSLRESLKDKSLSELEKILASYKTLHNKTDIKSVQRAIRAIEIEVFYQTAGNDNTHVMLSISPFVIPSEVEGSLCIPDSSTALRMTENVNSPLNSLIIGIHIDRELRRKKISNRMHYRL